MKKFLKYAMLARFIIVALAAVSTCVKADSFDINLTSIHWNSDYNYNEDNFGLGYTKDINYHWQAKVGGFKNSFSKTSLYALARLKHNMGKWDFGINMGFVTGYDDIEQTTTAVEKSRYHIGHRRHGRKHRHKSKTTTVNNGLKNAAEFQFIAYPSISFRLSDKHAFEIGHVPAISTKTVSTTTIQYQIRF